MRWVVFVVVAVNVLAAGRVVAGTVTCYAGNEQSKDAQIAVVIAREVDRDKHEVRIRSWRANAPHREIDTTFRVAADDRAYTFEARGMTGSGAFEGPTWAAYHHEGKAFGGAMVTDARIAGDTLTSEVHFDHAGHEEWRVTLKATAFECRDLAKQRAALDDSGSDAKRACFAGTQTILGKSSPVVVEQIVEPQRIVFITASAMLDNRVVLAVDGSAITASNGHAWSGKGSVVGKSGAWTGYTYRARISDADVRVKGTIGGTRVRRVESRRWPRSRDPRRQRVRLREARGQARSAHNHAVAVVAVSAAASESRTTGHRSQRRDAAPPASSSRPGPRARPSSRTARGCSARRGRRRR